MACVTRSFPNVICAPTGSSSASCCICWSLAAWSVPARTAGSFNVDAKFPASVGTAPPARNLIPFESTVPTDGGVVGAEGAGAEGAGAEGAGAEGAGAEGAGLANGL